MATRLTYTTEARSAELEAGPPAHLVRGRKVGAGETFAREQSRAIVEP